MANDKVVVNRKLFGSALVNVAELLIGIEGPNGYSDRVFEMFTRDGLNIGASAGSLRDWISQTKGWRKRYEAAVKTFEERKAGLDPNHPQLRKLERALKDKSAELSRLNQQLTAYDKKQTVFEQLADTLDEVVTPIDYIPFSGPGKIKGSHPVDLCVHLTDQHADSVIHGPGTWGLERYNFDIFCLRLERWRKLVAEYAGRKHLPGHNVERVHIFHTGDALQGDIHNAKYRNHFGNSMRAAVAVADAQSEAIADILTTVPYVSLIGVSGNHPRMTSRKDYVDPHDNFDFMVCALMAARLSNFIDAGRLDIHAPRAWSAFVDVRGKLMVLNHGDDVKGTWGIPWYGFARKEARVQALVGRKDARADFFWYGHFHTDMSVTETGARSVHSGAFTLTDPYAQNAITAGGEPMQAAMVVDDSPGMRSRLLDIPLWVRDPKREELYWNGKLVPTIGRSGALSVLAQADDAAGGGQLPIIRPRK